MYRYFFSTKKPPFIMESIYTKAYIDLGCVAIRKNGKVLLVLEEEKCNECNRIGFDLIKDQVRFKNFIDEFASFLDEAEYDAEDCVAAGNINCLLNIFEKFLGYYRYTESFYTDEFYVKKNDCKREQIESIKTLGRLFLNNFFNGHVSFLNRLANKIPDMPILYMTVDEINRQVQISDELAEERKNNHVMIGGEYYYNYTTLEYLYYETLMDEADYDGNIIGGLTVSSGKIQGTAYVLSADFTNYDNLEMIVEGIPKGIILVTETTSPDIVLACQKAIGIITNQGGYGSHAAIISRELKIPCIVNTKIATELICTGDIVTIDGENNKVIIKRK